VNSAPERADDGSAQEEKFEEVRVRDEIDEKLGFWRWEGGGGKNGDVDEREGWLVNMHQVRFGILYFPLRYILVFSGERVWVREDGEGEGRERRKERRVELELTFCSFPIC